MSEGNTNETTDEPEPEPTKPELHERVEQLESTVEKMMPSRRDALKLGAAGIAGAAGVAGASGSAEASTGSAGTIGSTSDRPDAFLDEANVNQLTGVSTGADRQGCRVHLSSDQSVAAGNRAKIQFDSEVYDSGNNYSTSSSEWTCPVDGLYAVNLQVEFVGGGNGEPRESVIGTGTNSAPDNEGAFNTKQSSDEGDRLAVSTINEYAQGDTIAGYGRNFNSNDILGGGPGNFGTFLEVAFLGGL